MSEPPDPYIGSVLHDTYRITRRIAEGGMGVVYQATHARLRKKRYAVKVLSPGAARNPDVYARFRREAEVTSELGHPNIVDVLDFYRTEDGRPFLVMEYLEGQDLGAYFEARGAVPAQELRGIINQICAGLQVAHDAGVVHRDMKPENVFLADRPGGSPVVKILDFGISKIRHSRSVVTQDRTVLGTPYYMSPEQAEGLVKDVDHTTDIFAVGVLVYQGLCGQLPFDAPTLLGVLRKICDTDPVPIAERVPGLGVPVQEVLDQALAKDKGQRYQRVEELAHDLGLALDPAAAEQKTRLYRSDRPLAAPQGEGPARITREEATLSDENGPTVPQSDSTGVMSMDDLLAEPGGRSPGVDRHGEPPLCTVPTQPNIASPGKEVQEPFDARKPAPPPRLQTTLRRSAGESVVIQRAARDPAHRMIMLLAGLMAATAAVVALLWVSTLPAPVTISPPHSSASPAVEPPAVADMVPPGPTAEPVPVATQLEPDPVPEQEEKKTPVTVELKLEPASAEVLMDGKRVASNPLSLPAATAPVQLTVQAPEHISKQVQLVPDSDQVLEVVLTPSPKPLAPAARSAVKPRQRSSRKRKVPREAGRVIRLSGDDSPKVIYIAPKETLGGNRLDKLEKPKPVKRKIIRPDKVRDPF